jgi:hypothetical protein
MAIFLSSFSSPEKAQAFRPELRSFAKKLQFIAKITQPAADF